MPLAERFVYRTYPTKPGEKGTPYAQSNGLGGFHVVRQIMTLEGTLQTEYAQDERGRLRQVATRAIRRYPWGSDDDRQWYPVTHTVANLAFPDTRGMYSRPQSRQKKRRSF